MTNHYWDRVTNRPATVYTPPEDVVVLDLVEPGWGSVVEAHVRFNSDRMRWVRFESSLGDGLTHWTCEVNQGEHWWTLNICREHMQPEPTEDGAP